MNQSNHLLLAAIGDKPDQDAFAEALASFRISAKVKFVPDYAAMKACLNNSTEGAANDCKPSLILLVAELGDAHSLDLIKEIKALENARQVPLIIVSKQHDEHQLKMAYRLGATSVIKHPTHFDSMVKVLQVLDEYWFNTVKLPINRS